MSGHKLELNLDITNDENNPQQLVPSPVSQYQSKKSIKSASSPFVQRQQQPQRVTALNSRNPLLKHQVKPIHTDKRSATVVLIGDSNCGKTSLVHTYLHKSLSTPAKTDLFETYQKTINFNKGVSVDLQIWDFPGNEYFDRFRPLAYANASGVLICFTLERLESLTHIKERWIPEVTEYCPSATKIIVGLGSEVRYDKTKMGRVPAYDYFYKYSKSLGCKYMECSLIDELSYSNIFKELALLSTGLEQPKVQESPSSLQVPKTRSTTRANTMQQILYLDESPKPQEIGSANPKPRVTSYRKRKTIIRCTIV